MHIPIIKFDSLIKDAIMRKFHIPDKITLWILFLWHIFSFCIILQIIIKELPCEREVQHCRDFLQTSGQGRLVSWDMYTNLKYRTFIPVWPCHYAYADSRIYKLKSLQFLLSELSSTKMIHQCLPNKLDT